MYSISQSKENTLHVYAYSNCDSLHHHLEGLVEHLHVYVNSPGVTITPYTNIIEGLLEHTGGVEGGLHAAPVKLHMEGLSLLKISDGATG